MRRSDWMQSWSWWVSMVCDARESCGGSNMPWAAFVMLLECFWLLMRRTHAGSLKVRLFFAGWTAMVYWMRVRTSLIMYWPWLWRTSLSAVCKHLSSSLVWQSPSTMPVCLSGRGISGVLIMQVGSRNRKCQYLSRFILCFLKIFITSCYFVTCNNLAILVILLMV